MERRLIDEIITLENSLRERIEEERRKAALWLSGEKNRLDTGVRAEDEKCSHESAEALETARREAESQAAMLLSEAENRASRMRAISDDDLRAIVLRHIGKVLR